MPKFPTNKIINKEDDKLIAYIEKNCSEFLIELEKADSFLYRGFGMRQLERKAPKAFVSSSMVNRPPKDNQVEIQKRYDQNLKMAGFTALRSNSIFCTGDESNAGNYGEVYAIFPINGFSFTWSALIDDFIHEDGDDYITSDVALKLKEQFSDFVEVLDDLESYRNYGNTVDKDFKILRKLIFDWRANERIYNLEENLTSYITYGKALIIQLRMLISKGKKGFNQSLLNKLINLVNKMKQSFKITPENAAQFVKRLKLKKDKLALGIDSGHEIWIHGKYIAILDDGKELIDKIGQHFNKLTS